MLSLRGKTWYSARLPSANAALYGKSTIEVNFTQTLQPLQYPYTRQLGNSRSIYHPPRKKRKSLRACPDVAVSRSPLSGTYENWKTEILNHFDGRYPSAAAGCINNKGRVITNCCHGVNSAGTLWNRLILDLNRAWEAVGRSIAAILHAVTN